jgi:tetratricopeptide (TPR) repeat protein
VAYQATYNDLVWMLDEEQQELLLRLTPRAFDDDRGAWAICLTQAYALRADAVKVRTYAGEARKAFEEQLRAMPKDAQRQVLLGLALAYFGRKEEAIREGERSLALLPVTRDALAGPRRSEDFRGSEPVWPRGHTCEVLSSQNAACRRAPNT